MSLIRAEETGPADATSAAVRIWPRRRSTALTLAGLLVLQVSLFLAATERSFFTHEDFFNFALAGDRSLLQYLATPIIHTYPAPGDRLLFFLLYKLFSLNYLAARLVLLAMLCGTTVLLGHLVRTLARSDAWWTVALLTPFALSLTLVSPVNLWSNGVPVMPALLLTVVAISAWLEAYTDRNATLWTGVAVAAVAAAGAFYMKFLLIPIYLLFFRVAILPRLLNVPGTLRGLWNERTRWVALAAPPALFLAVYVLSGLAARSNVPGDRPFAAYLATAWVHVFVPISLLNAPVNGSSLSLASWLIIAVSQLLFWTIVLATWRRSPLALRAWALLGTVFVVNLVMVGAVRLPGFGVQIAYWLRYYPEVVLFVPIALALCLRQGAERRPDVAWERTTAGQAAIGVLACVQTISFAVWAPRIVANSEGVRARVWVDHLRRDIHALSGERPAVRIVDSDTPDYVVLPWMVPYNRVSTVLGLLGIDIVYNDLAGPTYFVLPDGRLAESGFWPLGQLVPDASAGDRRAQTGRCLHDDTLLRYRPRTTIAGERLALRVHYAAKSRQPVALQVDTGDPDRQYRDLQLRPFQSAAELVDLGTTRIRGLTVSPSPSDSVCIDRMEIGSLRPNVDHQSLNR